LNGPPSYNFLILYSVHGYHDSPEPRRSDDRHRLAAKATYNHGQVGLGLIKETPFQISNKNFIMDSVLTFS
jgi:hypothetical protein